MASAFGHAFTAIAIGKSFSEKITNWKFLLLGSICSVLPDADVVGFKFGVSYESFWGHRGFTHSLLFALLLGILITVIFFKYALHNKQGIVYTAYFTICTASHSVLDAMTSGGLGVAFFSPWNLKRYFFSWRPIKVSPIGVENFFSHWGKTVLLSELMWIGIPCCIYILLIQLLRTYKRKT